MKTNIQASAFFCSIVGRLRETFLFRLRHDEREHEPRNRPLSPVWNIFDLTPEGRGDWNPKLEYD